MRLVRSLPVLLPMVLMLALTTFGVRLYLWLEPASDPSALEAKPVVVYIKPNTGVRGIADLLGEAGVIKSRWVFLALAFLEGSLTSLQAGEYQFSPTMSTEEVLKALQEGRVITHLVTIPEGFTLQQIAELLSSERLVDVARFEVVAQDPQFVASLGLTGDSVEGFLFPDTYRLTRRMSEEEIIRVMVGRFRQVFGPAFRARAREVDLSVREVVTLASVIEKEAKVNRERPLIAGVFVNRLRRDMPLQADPTIIYTHPDLRGRLTRADLRTPSPYNTYLRPGLPPGPISNPGRASLEAALFPARTPYLYFVAKNDGTHYFSRTLSDHERAVRRYQGGGVQVEAARPAGRSLPR